MKSREEGAGKRRRLHPPRTQVGPEGVSGVGSLPSSTRQTTVEESVHMLKSKREAAGLSLCPLTRSPQPTTGPQPQGNTAPKASSGARLGSQCGQSRDEARVQRQHGPPLPSPGA